MNSSGKHILSVESSGKNTDDAVPLARDAGVVFQPPQNTESDLAPLAEWLSLMEVVQMLCPEWPVRDQPMQGNNWKL